MSPLSYLVLVAFIILSVSLYLLDLQQIAAVTFFLGLLSPLPSKIPKSDIDIRLERVNRSTHKVVVENIGGARAKAIAYGNEA